MYVGIYLNFEYKYIWKKTSLIQTYYEKSLEIPKGKDMV